VDEGVVLEGVSVCSKRRHQCERKLTKLAKMRATVIRAVSASPNHHKSGEMSPTAKDELTLPDLGAQGDVLLRGTSGLLGGHLDCDPVVLGFAVVVADRQ
jgi:hypothetical protein